MTTRTRAAGFVVSLAFLSSALFADGSGVIQSDGDGTFGAFERPSLPDRNAGWKTVTSIVSSSRAESFLWAIPSSPSEEWEQAITAPARAAYRVRPVQGPLSVDGDSSVEFAGPPAKSLTEARAHAARDFGRAVRARPGNGTALVREGTVDTALLTGDPENDALVNLTNGVTLYEGKTWFERFGKGWLYFWRVTNGTETDYDFDWDTAAVQEPSGWSGALPAHSVLTRARYDRAVPRMDYSGTIAFTRPGSFWPDQRTEAPSFRPGRGGRVPRGYGYPPAIAICGEVDASLLAGDTDHDALVARTAGRPLVQAESEVSRFSSTWIYTWRVRNNTDEVLDFDWPAVPAAGGGWRGTVGARSEALLRVANAARPLVLQGSVSFIRTGTGETVFRTAAAAYVPGE